MTAHLVIAIARYLSAGEELSALSPQFPESPWLRKLKSAILHGIGEDAGHLAEFIADDAPPVTSPWLRQAEIVLTPYQREQGSSPA